MLQSNDDVLDNWEEIDEVGLNSKLDKLKKETATMNPIPAQNGKPMKMLMHDDDYRTQYGSTEPTVKILKRPSHDRANKSPQETKPKAPMKTLQQREHEYAQARLRILGSARSPDDISVQNIIVNKFEVSTGNSKHCGIITNGTISSQLDGLPAQLQRPQDGVLRLPRGPDGTTGFTIRR